MLTRNARGLALTALAAVALAGCGGIRVPVKERPAAQPTAAAQASCNRNQAGPDQVYVCPGDTLFQLAQAKDVTVANLKKVNGLTGNQIYAGTVLRLPDEYVYVVAPGDTLLDISRETGVSQEAILAANDFPNPDYLMAGTRVAIPRVPTQVAGRPAPAVTERPSAAETTPAPAANRATTTASVPVRTPTPSVTIGRSGPQQAPATEIPSQPQQQRETALAPQATPQPARPAAEEAAGMTAADSPRPRQRPADAPVRSARNEAASNEAAARKPADQAKAPSDAPEFLLPVEGTIVSDFGPKSGGLHNDGINIAAPRGTPIRAAANGTVAYAGDGLPGFGNLILVKHPGGWTSAYAHADTMAVQRGDSVLQGQTIGTVGDTGSVNQPQLHFELRQNDRAVDPKTLVR